MAFPSPLLSREEGTAIHGVFGQPYTRDIQSIPAVSGRWITFPAPLCISNVALALGACLGHLNVWNFVSNETAMWRLCRSQRVAVKRDLTSPWSADCSYESGIRISLTKKGG